MTVFALPTYRRSTWDERDELFLRCLSAAAVAGMIALLAMLFMPSRAKPVTSVEQVSPRMARLILEPPKAKVAAPLPARPAADVVKAEATPVEATPTPTPVRARRPNTPALAVDAGRAGRERATRDVAALAATSASLNSALDGLSATLGAASGPGTGSGPARPGRSRGVRTARGAEALGGGAGGLAGGAADLGGSVVAGSSVAIGGLESGGSGGGAAIGGTSSDAGGGSGAGAAPSVFRSNASLLSVIQRYAAGIQYCYGNELKRDPSLKGKLVVALTVAASGAVTEASIVQNSTGSSRLAQCALSQIRDWRFPPIAQGVTTFQTPFVFTPPQ